MPIKQSGALSYFYFESLPSFELVQGIFTRKGGISPTPWDSLNVGGTVGDERSNIIENRQRIFQAVGRNVISLFDVWQVHGTDVLYSDIPRQLDAPHQKADAILTDRPGLTLFMRFADCVPIFLYDPIRRAIGMVHAGWPGTVRKIVQVTIETMCKRFKSDPTDILAGIGPSIGPDHYPVGPEVIEQVREAFGSDAQNLLHQRDAAIHFDLWQANRITLEQSGVKHIELAGLCTGCDTNNWFSHRGDRGKTGRFGAVLSMNE
jgi:YfiH family protein